MVAELTKLPRGLVLVTGPTGSGKSTTLAAMIDKINRERHEHIVTVEDPIEFVHEHRNCLVNQREVFADTHSFAEALRHVLRQDPDIVLIGEMRDLETVESALTVAETGHLVLRPCTPTRAVQTINRIIDIFPPHQQPQVRAQLSLVLQAVISQQLIPRLDGHGRVLAVEVMIPNAAIRNLIREEKIHQIYSQLQVGQIKFGHADDDPVAGRPLHAPAHLVRRGDGPRDRARRAAHHAGRARAHVPQRVSRALGGGDSERRDDARTSWHDLASGVFGRRCVRRRRWLRINATQMTCQGDDGHSPMDASWHRPCSFATQAVIRHQVGKSRPAESSGGKKMAIFRGRASTRRDDQRRDGGADRDAVWPACARSASSHPARSEKGKGLDREISLPGLRRAGQAARRRRLHPSVRAR